MRTLSSGNLSILRTFPTQPYSWRSSSCGFSISGFFWRTTTNKRLPATTSSTSLIDDWLETSKGATMKGNTTRSLNGSTGNSEGIACGVNSPALGGVCDVVTVTDPLLSLVEDGSSFFGDSSAMSAPV